MSDLLDLFDAHIGSVVAPAHASNSPIVLPAPLRATYEEVRAAQGPVYTVSPTPELERYLAARRAARDAAREAVVVAYRADKRPGAWDRRQEALARITATVPDRRAAEDQQARDVAIAVQAHDDSVTAHLRALYPN